LQNYKKTFISILIYIILMKFSFLKYFISGAILFVNSQILLLNAQSLTIEKIMQHESWIGAIPFDVEWAANSKKFFFKNNPENLSICPLWKYSIEDQKSIKCSDIEYFKNSGTITNNNKRIVNSIDGDLYIYHVDDNTQQQLTFTKYADEHSPFFANDDNFIFYKIENNYYSLNLNTNTTTQLTDFVNGEKPEKEKTKELSVLEKSNLEIFQYQTKNKETDAIQKTYLDSLNEKKKSLTPIYSGDKFFKNSTISNDGNYVLFVLRKESNGKYTDVPDYMTANGYTTTIGTRPKVGDEIINESLGIYDVRKDTFCIFSIKEIPDIYESRPYTCHERGTQRVVEFGTPIWNKNNDCAVVEIRTNDNKDRWIAKITPDDFKLTSLFHRNDSAWIGGPGIGEFSPNGILGWYPNNIQIWFHSDHSGYSHVYECNTQSGTIRNITSGNYNVYQSQISMDGKYFYLTTNEKNFAERHFYKKNIQSGVSKQITTKEGNNTVYVSPDEKWLVIRHSDATHPWQLYLAKNEENISQIEITNTISQEFKSYPWQKPQIVTYEASDGETVYAKLLSPNPLNKNNKAIVFVHGAGYLQEAHKWWSYYFRENLFHNLLIEKGYTVLVPDYRASDGYSRNWRTDIYRNMGNRDLDDVIDGAKYLTKIQKIDSLRIGIYGGSYGGFITLMALFKYPEVFACGAALRAVTDWDHYNHGYTSNILNTPVCDKIAYERSSAIRFASGLNKPLLICHGLIDTNVHFQDIVRLSQRLIELGKTNWWVQFYPIEDHAFKNPSSWTDEYKRILELFENNMK